jgi:ABC-2 type transport system ATP-binding protein
MLSAISVQSLSKTFPKGLQALKNINLEISRGEIFALLGPNGAGKTTLISVICGLVNKTAGTVLVEGHDNVTDFRNARRLVGLVPQELHLSIFETVWDTCSFSRALFGLPDSPAAIEKILRQLSLYDKKDEKIMALSGGMKRRVLIAKALAHEPQILFLDEPTAGVDVDLRKEMWKAVEELRANGVTIILTTHYIEEAEQLADRVGVINKGEMILVENKAELMKKMGQKRLRFQLDTALTDVPPKLAKRGLQSSSNGMELILAYDAQKGRPDIAGILKDFEALGIAYHDLNTEQNSLEDIFVGLVKQ